MERIEEYYDNPDMLPLVVRFELIKLTLDEMQNGELSKSPIPCLIGIAVQLTKDSIDGIRWYRELEKCFGKAEFNIDTHLSKSRRKRNWPRILMQYKIWCLYNTGDYGKNKKVAAIRMLDDLKKTEEAKNYTGRITSNYILKEVLYKDETEDPMPF